MYKFPKPWDERPKLSQLDFVHRKFVGGRATFELSQAMAEADEPAVPVDKVAEAPESGNQAVSRVPLKHPAESRNLIWLWVKTLYPW